MARFDGSVTLGLDAESSQMIELRGSLSVVELDRHGPSYIATGGRAQCEVVAWLRAIPYPRHSFDLAR